ncbi:MAG: glycosyltransferase family 39 protein [Salegentibacter sp.]
MKNKFYLILLVIFVVLLAGSGSWGLTESSEARYAEIAREMVKTGDYLHPGLLGIHHYHKPPVTYQITALGYQIFGFNEFGARFFLAVALVLQIFFVFKIGLLLFKEEKVAFASALIYFTFPVALIAARNLTTDAFLTTFILWALFYWLKNKEGKGKVYLYGFYVLLGIGMLTKGPVILLPPVIFILCWKIVFREKLRISVHTLLGTLLFLVISASWYVAVILDHPALLDYFVKDQIVKRSLEAEKFHRSEPFWYYFALAPVIGLPWLLFSASGAVKHFKDILKNRRIELVLLFSFCILFLIFSLFSSKLILYILPIFPYAALLGGSLLFRASGKRLKIYSRIYLGLLAVLFVALIVLPFVKNISFNLLWALPVLLFLAASTVYFLRYGDQKKRFTPVYLGLAFTIALLATYALFAAQNPYTINSVKDLTAVAKAKGGDDLNRVIVYNYLLPSAAFYLDEDVVTVNNGNFNTRREVEFEKDSLYKRNFIDLEKEGEAARLKQLLEQKHNVLIMRKRTELADSLQYLLKNFSAEEEHGKWKVYY